MEINGRKFITLMDVDGQKSSICIDDIVGYYEHKNTNGTMALVIERSTSSDGYYKVDFDEFEEALHLLYGVN